MFDPYELYGYVSRELPWNGTGDASSHFCRKLKMWIDESRSQKAAVKAAAVISGPAPGRPPQP